MSVSNLLFAGRGIAAIAFLVASLAEPFVLGLEG
jgi:hypothetical protein